ncbi:hypothetical protein MBRA_02522 [Methylobacterium brachiatum]|nr:hypothetical protein MBRA_02522 [Methylobacterium brachiatum]
MKTVLASARASCSARTESEPAGTGCPASRPASQRAGSVPSVGDSQAGKSLSAVRATTA